MKPYSQLKADPSQSNEMHAMLRWIERFLCGLLRNQHVVNNRRDHTGALVTQADFDARSRKAHGCPFVQDALDIDNIWLEESALTERDQSQIEALIRSQIPSFLATSPAYDPRVTGKPAGVPELFKAFIFVFPRVLYSKGYLPMFETIQNTIKIDFIRCGMMSGQFYYGCPQPGLYNPAFRPLSAPWPVFAVRYMVKDDILFNR